MSRSLLGWSLEAEALTSFTETNSTMNVDVDLNRQVPARALTVTYYAHLAMDMAVPTLNYLVTLVLMSTMFSLACLFL